MRRISLTALLVLLCSTILSAQSLDSHRFEERTFSLGGGLTTLLDTYLSPLTYEGAHVSVMDERFSQTAVANGRWFGQSLFLLHGDYTLAAEGRGLTVGGMADYTYTCYYNPIHTDRWNLCVGPQGRLRLGGIYNLRNSNNPAQLKLETHIAASVMAKYAFTLWNTPMKVRLQTDLPLVGVAFAPDYGQSYYEIFYLGQDEECVHVTAPHNNLSLRTNLSWDVQFRFSTVRLTLLNDLYHWQLGGQQYRMFTHSLMIGYVSNLYHVMREDKVREYIPY